VEAARSEAAGVAGTHVSEGRTAQVKPSDVGRVKAPAKVPANLAKQRLRTVRETSAGGLMVSGLDGPQDERCAALIGRVDRRGRMMWSLPKGHIETGETAEQTAIREVAEETGIKGNVVAPLGKIDYWFVSEGKRIHKTVHHYLMRFTGGELSDADYEVAEVAWVPLAELPRRLTYSDERRLARVAEDVIAELVADPDRMAEYEAQVARTEPNAYEKAAAARNQKRNEPPPPAQRPRRRRRRGRRGSGNGGVADGSEKSGHDHPVGDDSRAGNSGGPAAHAPPPESGPHIAT
jgi:ADP-ribose pyrophosphatase YjhB (NUDIX family)